MPPSPIAAWLEALELGQYTAAFEAADITPGICGTLTDHDLREIGVASLGHRRRLLAACAAGGGLPTGHGDPATPAWVDELPSILAVGVDEWFREPDPVLRLWHACDVAELTLRLLAIAGLSELHARERAGGAPLGAELRARIRSRLEAPTLGKWQGIATAVAARLEQDSPSADLARLVERELIPLLDGRPGDGADGSLRQLRNQLAHGGGVTKARARALLGGWLPRLSGFVAALGAARGMRLVVRTPEGFGLLRGPTATARPWAPADAAEGARLEQAFRTPGDVVLAGPAACHSLWPLSLYAVAYDDGRGSGAAAPQVYVRRGEVGLVYTPIGSPDAAQHTAGDEALAAFEQLVRAPDRGAERAFRIAGFEAQLEREAPQLVGRGEERERLHHWVADGRGRCGVVLGGAGTGKSLLLARLATELLDGQAKGDAELILPFRCKGGDERCNRESFLLFTAERLAARLGRAAGDAVPSLAELTALLQEAPPALLLVDGLDEIAERDPGFIAEVLRPLLDAGARVLAAGRPEMRVTAPLAAVGAEEIFPGGLPLMREGDIRTMILERTGPLRRILLARDAETAGAVRNDAIERITRAAGGLPLYVNYVIGDLLARRISLETLDRLPPTLAAYHERLLERGRVGDLALVGTPLLAGLCLAHEPLTSHELTGLLVGWGLLEPGDDAGRVVAAALRVLEPMIRRAAQPGGEEGFLPYHHSLRQHLLASGAARHAVGGARRTFRALARRAATREEEPALAGYLRRQGAQHLADDGTVGETLALVTALRERGGPLERRRNLAALNRALEVGRGIGELEPGTLLGLLAELHDGAEIAPGARALYLHHRAHLGTESAALLRAGFAVTYELAAEAAAVEAEREAPEGIRDLLEWAEDRDCPAQYAASNALNYLFMLQPNRVPGEFLARLARGNPYDRMVVLNGLMFRALEGRCPLEHLPDGPFWRSRWPYLARDAVLVRACHAHIARLAPGADAAREEIRAHLRAIDALAADLGARPAVQGDPDLARIAGGHWLAVAHLRPLRHLRERLVLHPDWLDLGRLLLANPFWQIAAIGAETLAERHRTRPADRPAIELLLAGHEPFPGAGLLGDRDSALVDLARLTLADERDPAAIADRIGRFLASPSSHQRAEAALHLTQLLPGLPEVAARELTARLAPALARNAAETDIWAVHELVEFHRALEERGIPPPPGFDLDTSPVLREVPGWRHLDDEAFTAAADAAWELPGVRAP
jgi:hypothetical protein